VTRSHSRDARASHTVEVVRRRFGFHSFVTGFPEPEHEALKARWRTLPLWFDNSSGSHGDAPHQYNSIAHHGGHGVPSAAVTATVEATAVTNQPIKDLRV
jgi:hypothetical protein